MFTSRTRHQPICVILLVERRYLTHAEPRGVGAALAERGVAVRTVVAEDSATEVTGATDTTGGVVGGDLDPGTVVCPRGRSAALLGMLRALEARGATTLHTAAAIDGVVDKAGMAARLSAAGVPTPTTWLGHPGQLAKRPDLLFPLVLKPIRGDNSRGIAVVSRVDELEALAWNEEVALAQPFHRGDAHDLKIYVAGGRVWAVRRRSPIRPDGAVTGDSDPGTPVAVTDEIRSLATRCSTIFGLTLFGIDCVSGPSGRWLVVEVNDFPNYRGIADDVDGALADVVLDHVFAVAGPEMAARA